MATAKRDPSPKLRRSDYLSFFGSAKGREFLNNLERKHATAKRRVGGRSVSSTAPTATTITDAIARATNPIPGDEIGNGQSSSAQVVRRESLLEDEDEDEGECRNNDNDASGGNHVAAVVVECVVEQQESTSQWEGLHQLSSVSGAVAAPPHSRAHAEESGIANGDDDEDRVVNHGYETQQDHHIPPSSGRVDIDASPNPPEDPQPQIVVSAADTMGLGILEFGFPFKTTRRNVDLTPPHTTTSESPSSKPLMTSLEHYITPSFPANPRVVLITNTQISEDELDGRGLPRGSTVVLISDTHQHHHHHHTHHQKARSKRGVRPLGDVLLRKKMRNSDIRDTARLRMRVFKLHRAGVEKSEFVFATGPVGWGMKRGMAEWGVGVGGERRAKRVKRGMEDDGGVESVVEVVSDADVMEVVEEIVVEEKFGGSSRPDSKCVSPVEETEIDDELVATVSPDLVEVEKAVEETAEVGSMEVDDPTVVEVLSVEAEAPSPIFTTDEEDSKGINMEVIQEEDIVIEEEEDATEMVAVLPVVDVSAPVSSPTVSSPAMIAETEFQFDEHPMAELERIQLLSTPPASPALSDVDETTDETETKTDSDELSMMDLQLWSPPKSDDDTDTSLPATPCPIKPLSQYENYKLIPYSYLLTSPPATPIAATRKPVERIIEFCSGFDVRPPSPPVSHFESPLAIRINREMLMELPMQETQSSQGRFGETIDEEIEDDEEDEEVEDDEHEEIEDEDEDIEEIIRSPRFYHPSPPASPVFESFPIMELEAAGLKELVVPSPMISRHHTPAPGAHDNYDYDEACAAAAAGGAGYFDFSAAGSHDSPAIAGACPTPLRKSYGGLGIIDSPCSSKSQHLFRSSSRDSAAARETSLELTHPPLQDFAMTRKTSTRSARSGSTSFAAAYDDYTVARCNTPSREAWMCDDKGDISTTTRPELLPTPSASYGGHSRPNTPASSVGTALTRRWSSISRMSYNTNITTPPVTRPGTSMETPANGKLLIWDNEDFENQELQLCYAQNYPQELVPPVRRLMSHEESTATALENSKEDITTPELRQTTPVVVDIPQTPRSAKSSSTTSPRRLNQKRRTVSLPITREEWVIHTPVIITPPQPLTATVTTTTPEPEQDEWKVTQTAGSFQLLPLSRTIVFKPPKITATNTQTGEQVDLFSSLPKERHDDPTVISGPLTRKPSMTMATTTSTTTTAQSIPTIRITSVSPATKQRRFRSMIEYHPGHEDALEGIDELFEDLEDLAAIEKELQLQSLPPASLPPPHRRLLLAPPSPHRSRPVSSIFSSFSSSSGEEEDYDVSAVVGLENAREGIEEIPRDPEARKRGLLRRIRERARKVAEKVKEKARNSNFSSSSSASSTVKREKKVKKEKEKLGSSVVSSAANSTASLGIPTSTSAAGPGAAGFGTIVSSPSSTSLSSNPDSFISSASNSASKQSRIPRIPRLPLRRPTSPTPSVASSAPTIPVAALPKMVKAEAKAQKKREEQMARDRERIEKERRKEWEREEREREKRRREEEKEREKERERVKREEKKSAVSGGKTKIPGLGKKEKKENNEKEKKRFGFKAKTKTKVKA